MNSPFFQAPCKKLRRNQWPEKGTPACTGFSEIRDDHAREILEICEKRFILSTIDTHWMTFNKEGDEIKHIKQNKSGFCVENTVEAGQLDNWKKTRILLLWLKLRLVFWKKAEAVEIYLNR